MTAVELIAAHPWIVKLLRNIDPMKMRDNLSNYLRYDNNTHIYFSYHWCDEKLFKYRYIQIYKKPTVAINIYSYDSKFCEQSLFHDLFKLCNNFDESLINFI